jgi:hypothetical protein
LDSLERHAKMATLPWYIICLLPLSVMQSSNLQCKWNWELKFLTMVRNNADNYHLRCDAVWSHKISQHCGDT